jgi:hypothetical protein
MKKSAQKLRFEVQVLAPVSGRWRWQVCANREAIVCGEEATREAAESEGDTALLFLLSLGN